MFLDFFLLLKNQGIPVTIKEYLNLLEGIDKKVIDRNVDNFYYLCKAVLVKQEKHLDRFDQLFGLYFKGIETITDEELFNIPKQWLDRNAEKLLSPQEMEKIKSMGGLDKTIR